MQVLVPPSKPVVSGVSPVSVRVQWERVDGANAYILEAGHVGWLLPTAWHNVLASSSAAGAIHVSLEDERRGRLQSRNFGLPDGITVPDSPYIAITDVVVEGLQAAATYVFRVTAVQLQLRAAESTVAVEAQKACSPESEQFKLTTTTATTTTTTAASKPDASKVTELQAQVNTLKAELLSAQQQVSALQKQRIRGASSAAVDSFTTAEQQTSAKLEAVQAALAEREAEVSECSQALGVMRLRMSSLEEDLARQQAATATAELKAEALGNTLQQERESHRAHNAELQHTIDAQAMEISELRNRVAAVPSEPSQNLSRELEAEKQLTAALRQQIDEFKHELESVRHAALAEQQQQENQAQQQRAELQLALNELHDLRKSREQLLSDFEASRTALGNDMQRYDTSLRLAAQELSAALNEAEPDTDTTSPDSAAPHGCLNAMASSCPTIDLLEYVGAIKAAVIDLQAATDASSDVLPVPSPPRQGPQAATPLIMATLDAERASNLQVELEAANERNRKLEQQYADRMQSLQEMLDAATLKIETLETAAREAEAAHAIAREATTNLNATVADMQQQLQHERDRFATCVETGKKWIDYAERLRQETVVLKQQLDLVQSRPSSTAVTPTRDRSLSQGGHALAVETIPTEVSSTPRPVDPEAEIVRQLAQRQHAVAHALLEMNFPLDACIEAAKRFDGVDAAVEWIVTGTGSA